MATLLSIIIILASILLILIVFIQNPKGGGLSTDFGAAHQIGGVQETNNFIENATWSLAGIIAVCSIVLTIIKTPDVIRKQEAPTTEQQQAPQKGQQSPNPGK